MKTAIIGAGASGLLLANLLKDEYVLIEKADRVGKKLLATGNGKCNLTNINISPDGYNAPEFVAPFLEKFPPSKTVRPIISAMTYRLAHVWDGLPICISRPASGLWSGDWISTEVPLPSGVHWMRSIAADMPGYNRWWNQWDIIYVWSSIVGWVPDI